MRACVQTDAQHSQRVHPYIKHMPPPFSQLHASLSCPCVGSFLAVSKSTTACANAILIRLDSQSHVPQAPAS